MKRIITEAEDEFDYVDQNKRFRPRVLVADKATLTDTLFSRNTDTPPFLLEFIITADKLQPVKIKVDSVLEKGSKIMAKHPKSNYIDGTLFLMAKAYFYKSEYLPSQIKCQELIENYPTGSFSPIGHLFLAKNQLLQHKYSAGELTLSRTVDVAWGMEDYDVLSEAFHLQAEMALYNNDLELALKPYRRAIAQSDDKELQARWQMEIGSILYRRNEFEYASKELNKVKAYKPDILAQFESRVYLGASLARLEKYTEADEIFTKLEENSNFKEWKGYVFAERLNMMRLQGDSKEMELRLAEHKADSAFVGIPAISATYYQRGLQFFKKGDYLMARKYFARAKSTRSPVSQFAIKYFTLLNSWEEKTGFAVPQFDKFTKNGTGTDTSRTLVASALYEVARIQSQLGNQDSALIYYEKASIICPKPEISRAQYLFAQAISIQKANPKKADTLYDEIAQNYPLTEYAAVARVHLGYTDAAIVDTAAELYASGTQFRKVGEYSLAVRQYSHLAENFRTSSFAPRSLYSAGWLNERRLMNLDSAIYYYKLLIERYPNTEYAKDVRQSLLYVISTHSGTIDSSLIRQLQPQNVKGKQMSDSMNIVPPLPTNEMPRPSSNPQLMPIQNLPLQLQRPNQRPDAPPPNPPSQNNPPAEKAEKPPKR